MNNWDPKEHPRDMRTGRFSESWIAAVDAALPGPPQFSAEDRADIEELRRYVGSRSLTHDMSTWSPGKLKGVRDKADQLLVKHATKAATLTDDEYEDVYYIRGKADREFQLWLNTPPWEGGPKGSDEVGQFQQQWVEGVHAYLDQAGIDPVKFEKMAEQYDGSTADAYKDFLVDAPDEYALHIISETIDAMGPGGMTGTAQRQFLSEIWNAHGFFVHGTMPSYDHEDAREFKAYHLAEHEGFTTKGWFEILTPDGEWNILEDVEHDDEQQEVTIWAGDHHYTIDATDDVTVRAPDIPELADIYVEGG